MGQAEEERPKFSLFLFFLFFLFFFFVNVPISVSGSMALCPSPELSLSVPQPSDLLPPTKISMDKWKINYANTKRRLTIFRKYKVEFVCYCFQQQTSGCISIPGALGRDSHSASTKRVAESLFRPKAALW